MPCVCVSVISCCVSLYIKDSPPVWTGEMIIVTGHVFNVQYLYGHVSAV